MLWELTKNFFGTALWIIAIRRNIGLSSMVQIITLCGFSRLLVMPFLGREYDNIGMQVVAAGCTDWLERTPSSGSPLCRGWTFSFKIPKNLSSSSSVANIYTQLGTTSADLPWGSGVVSSVQLCISPMPACCGIQILSVTLWPLHLSVLAKLNSLLLLSGLTHASSV